MFGFQKQVSLVSFTPKKKKSEVLLSTMHHDASVDTETKKPEIVHFYNSTKRGVDTFDQFCGNYSVSRRTRRRPLCIFFQLFNIAGVNGHILHNITRSEDNAQKRRQFLKNLAMGLIKPHMENGALLKNLPIHIRCFLAKYKPHQEEATAEFLQNIENGVACVEEWKTEWQRWGVWSVWSVIHVQILQRMTNKHWRTGPGLFSDIPNFLNCVILFSNIVLNYI